MNKNTAKEILDILQRRIIKNISEAGNERKNVNKKIENLYTKLDTYILSKQSRLSQSSESFAIAWVAFPYDHPDRLNIFLRLLGRSGQSRRSYGNQASDLELEIAPTFYLRALPNR